MTTARTSPSGWSRRGSCRSAGSTRSTRPARGPASYERCGSSPAPASSSGRSNDMMTHREALEVLAAHRRDHVVVTTMGSAAYWPTLSDTPRDFHFLPSSMGQGVSLGLGLCLAKPGLGVV